MLCNKTCLASFFRLSACCWNGSGGRELTGFYHEAGEEICSWMSLQLDNGYQHDCYVIGTSISDSFAGDFVTCVLEPCGDWIDLNIFRACEMVKRNEQSC